MVIKSAKLKGLEKEGGYAGSIYYKRHRMNKVWDRKEIDESLKQSLESVLNYIDNEIEGWKKYKKGVYQNQQLVNIANNFIAHLKELREFYVKEFCIEEE